MNTTEKETTPSMNTTENKTTRTEALKHIEGYIHAGSVIYWDSGTRRWYVGDEADLDYLCALMDDDEEVSTSAYSHWCSGTCHAEFRSEDEARARANGRANGGERD